MINTGKLTPPTDAEKEQLRNEHDEIILSTGTSSSGHKMHLPESSDGYEIRCNSEKKRNISDHPCDSSKKWKRKSLAVYPMGFKPWCMHCVYLWQQDSGSDQAAQEFLNEVTKQYE